MGKRSDGKRNEKIERTAEVLKLTIFDYFYFKIIKTKTGTQ